MHTNHKTPKKIVMRSRFRSTTEDEPRVELTPPPNRSDSPPPLPLWSSTRRIITRLVMIRITESPTTIAVIHLLLVTRPRWRESYRHGHDRPGSRCAEPTLLSLRRQFTIPADLSELPGVEAGSADEGAVDVRQRHDRRDVAGLDGPAIQDTHTGGRFGAMKLRNPRPDRRRRLLHVVGSGHLAGADSPDRLVGDHHRRHVLGLESLEALVELAHAEAEMLPGLANLERLPQAQDRREPGPQRGQRLGVDQVVGLAVVLPPLGVPGQHVLAAQ